MWMNGNSLVWLSGHLSKYPSHHLRSKSDQKRGLIVERSRCPMSPSLPSPWNARWCTGTMWKPTRVIQQTPSLLEESRWCTSYVLSSSHLLLPEWGSFQERANESRKIPFYKIRTQSNWWSTQRSYGLYPDSVESLTDVPPSMYPLITLEYRWWVDSWKYPDLLGITSRMSLRWKRS